MKLPPTSRSPLVSLIYSDLLQFSQVIKGPYFCCFIFRCPGRQTRCRAPWRGKPAAPSPVGWCFAPPATLLPVASPTAPDPLPRASVGGDTWPPAAGRDAEA